MQGTLSQKLYGIGKYLPWALQLSKNTLVFPVILTQKLRFFVLLLTHLTHIDVYGYVYEGTFTWDCMRQQFGFH